MSPDIPRSVRTVQAANAYDEIFNVNRDQLTDLGGVALHMLQGQLGGLR